MFAHFLNFCAKIKIGAIFPQKFISLRTYLGQKLVQKGRIISCGKGGKDEVAVF